MDVREKFQADLRRLKTALQDERGSRQELIDRVTVILKEADPRLEEEKRRGAWAKMADELSQLDCGHLYEA
jgi:hypothetical protein